MVDEDKLIKQGIRLTDAWFKKFKKQIEHDLSLCKTYEEFLERTKDYTTANILINSGYSAEMEKLITLALTNTKFLRASQRELLEQTIKYNVGNLIQSIGEDIKTIVRDEVSKGYDEGLHSHEIGKRLTKQIDTINNTRARTIARTEVNRTQTIAEYVTHKDRGAKGFSVKCRPDCCPLCAEDYADVTDPNYTIYHNQIQNLNRRLKTTRNHEDKKLIKDEVEGLMNQQNKITGSDGGKLIGGNVQFTMDQTEMLPPRHPNCRCSVNFYY